MLRGVRYKLASRLNLISTPFLNIVATRLVHAYIHTGTNNVKVRFYAMLTGVVILGAMWVIFAIRILFGWP